MRPASKFQKLSWDQIEMLNEDWENNEQTSRMWEIISHGEWSEFVGLLQEYPEMAHIRSEDGRGPMWWAHEHGRPRMVDVLRQVGVSEERSDVKGIKPNDISSLPR
jgi:dolichyl-diphosphooligosaccharide--protein glycosyltransferase